MKNTHNISYTKLIKRSQTSSNSCNSSHDRAPSHGSNVSAEVTTLATMLAKAQKAVETAEVEIGRLGDELRQSSDKEKGVREMARKGEARAEGHIAKIRHLKMALDELKAKTKMGTECIRTLLHSHQDRFVRQLKEAMNWGVGLIGETSHTIAYIPD